MFDGNVVLSREQRDEIMRAIGAIERQVKEIKPGWQAGKPPMSSART